MVKDGYRLEFVFHHPRSLRTTNQLLRIRRKIKFEELSHVQKVLGKDNYMAVNDLVRATAAERFSLVMGVGSSLFGTSGCCLYFYKVNSSNHGVRGLCYINDKFYFGAFFQQLLVLGYSGRVTPRKYADFLVWMQIPEI